MVSEFLRQCETSRKLQNRSIPEALNAGLHSDIDLVSDRKLVVFTGCGDSYAVAQYGQWALLQEGINAVALSASEVNRLSINQGCTVIGITASGRSLSTIDAMDYGKEHGAATVALTDNRNGPITEHVDTLWLTDTHVKTYNIIPTAPTTAALAYLFGIVGQINEKRYHDDVELLRTQMYRIHQWAEKEGEKLSALIDRGHTVYFISEGPNYVAAQLGMMKVNESSLTLGVSVLREEFQHYGSLPTRTGDAAVLVTDSPSTESDQRFLHVLKEILALRTFHINLPVDYGLKTPLAQVIANTLVVQTAVLSAILRDEPEKEWFRLPHAKAFRIY
ncbi:MAG: hypothetical protein DRO73_03575 [Candidatus Thorarchaeota archaeon]|nr:MAG: hypothetical protein DRO73_03575 [Candidatus Thorarchaeota archaeon]